MDNCTNISCTNVSIAGEGVDVEEHGTVDYLLGVAITVMLVLVVFSMGCAVETGTMWAHIRRPWALLVGMGCQFGLMPPTAYALATVFSVKPAQAVAILIIGCCPGGAFSNIVAYWVDGDLDLSITLTSCSFVFAMGLMPLCLFLYSWSWDILRDIKIPYTNIGIALVSLVAPVACGMLVNYKWPMKAKLIAKVGSLLGGAMVIVLAIVSSVIYKGSWDTDGSIIVIALIHPLIGYTSGFAVATLVRQPWHRCRTIAIETGTQNINMCSTVLQLSFSKSQLVQMYTFPLIYAFFQSISGLLLVAVFQVYKRRCQKASEEKTMHYPEMSCQTAAADTKSAVKPYQAEPPRGVVGHPFVKESRF